MTFIRRAFGVAVIRAPHLKRNLIWQAAIKETTYVYHSLRWQLEKQGFKLIGAVIDGKPGLINAFGDIPVQMCQFHQIAIITRYLTTRPKLLASQELRKLTMTLSQIDEYDFELGLKAWYERRQLFLKEKTLNPETKRWFYTHKRLRSAHRSLKNNLGLLFTYQRYPELNLPNTTNSLDGTFSHLKNMLGIHRGLKAKRKLKLIAELLPK
ncbi:hypothetical protein KJ840_02175 [Patescibacteria group bacterium]|nr:hypothetical protein [Patescibacteria group bacterium]